MDPALRNLNHSWILIVFVTNIYDIFFTIILQECNQPFQAINPISHKPVKRKKAPESENKDATYISNRHVSTHHIFTDTTFFSSQGNYTQVLCQTATWDEGNCI